MAKKALRDESFETYDEALAEVTNFLETATGLSWAGVVKGEDGKFIAVLRPNRPCYGEMRRYADGTRPNDPHPGDIPHVIPKGERLVFGAPLLNLGESHNEVIEFMFNPEVSPWRRGLGKNIRLFKKGDMSDPSLKYTAMMMTDTNVDPTVLANLLVNIRLLSYVSGSLLFGFYRSRGHSALRSFIGAVFSRKITNQWTLGGADNMYALNFNTEIPRFVSGETLDLSNGQTWREQEDYNRPELADIFGKSGINLYSHFTVRTVQEPFDKNRQAEYMLRLEEKLIELCEMCNVS